MLTFFCKKIYMYTNYDSLIRLNTEWHCFLTCYCLGFGKQPVQRFIADHSPPAQVLCAGKAPGSNVVLKQITKQNSKLEVVSPGIPLCILGTLGKFFTTIGKKKINKSLCNININPTFLFTDRPI